MRQIVYFLALTTVLSSCYKYPQLIYLRDDINMFSDRPTVIETNPEEYIVQYNDILSIQVQSTDPEVAELFNVNRTNAFMFADPGTLYLMGYPVDNSGKVKLAIIGDVLVKGKTVREIESIIQAEVDKYIINSTVIVKLVSFKVTILGEVRNPGMYYIFNGQATIFEALGMAGDITNLGKREEVKLIRQMGETSQVVLLDLTNPQMLVSKYYFVQPNDVIYVEPFKQQTERLNLELLSLIALFSSLVGTTLLLINYFGAN